MRILIAAKHPPGGALKIGGVQSWSAAIGDELKARGHDVSYWGPGQPNPTGSFHLGVIANIGDTSRVLDQCYTNVVVCHGIIPAEDPHHCLHDGPVIFTSEEVREYWKGTGDIIRQPISTDFWSPVDCEKKFLTRFSYREGLPFIPEIAERLKLEYRHVRSETPEAARDILRQSKCVVATGRGALEAMSCGVPVVIADDRTYMGPMLDNNTLGSMKRNFSGRGGVVPTLQNVEKAIVRAIAAGSLRSHVEQHHDVRDITDQLLEYAC